MPNADTTPMPPPGTTPLLEVLGEEARLLEAVAAALVEQRAAVAASDAARLETLAGTLEPTLESLRRVRAQREDMTRAVGGDANEPLSTLAARLGPGAASPFETARVRITRAARAVARESRINRAVVRRVTEAGEAFLQELFGGEAPRTPSYDGSGARRDGAPSGAFLDRRI